MYYMLIAEINSYIVLAEWHPHQILLLPPLVHLNYPVIIGLSRRESTRVRRFLLYVLYIKRLLIGKWKDEQLPNKI